MLSSFELIFGAFILIISLFFFYSPLIVSILLTICFTIFLIKWKYYGINYGINSMTNSQRMTRQLRQKSNSMSTYGTYGQNSNIRVIKSAKRHQLSRNENLFEPNLMSKFSTNQLNSNYFDKSDGLLSSINLQTFPSINQMSYKTAVYNSRDNYSIESPNSQLGNIPRVRLTPNESTPYELSLKNKCVKPVTVRIAPMPTNISTKFTLNRLSNPNTTIVSTFGMTDNKTKENTSTQTKSIVEALKLKRKREQKYEIESEESFKLSTNKKAKREVSNNSNLFSQKTPNGLIMPLKQSVKRTSMASTSIVPKRVKNNEILSSYSSLQSPNLGLIKAKRKLSPDSSAMNEVEPKRTVLPNDQLLDNISTSVINEDIVKDDNINELLINSSEKSESEESIHKKSYGLPFHLHSMEDHEHDRNKARKRLNRFKNVIQEVKGPKSEQKTDEPLITPLTTPLTTPSTTPSTTTIEVVQNISTSEIALPTEPAAAIFTNSRVETSVTTTLLNAPISSVLTTSRDSLSPSTHVVSADHNDSNGDNCSMTSAPNSPEVSTITNPFNTSLITQTTNSLSTQNAIKFGTSSTDNNPKSTTSSTPFVSSAINMFSPSVSTSSSLQIPQFSSISSSAPLPIPDLSQSRFTFTGSSQSQPTHSTLATFPNLQQNQFSSETQSQSIGAFSMGSFSKDSNRRPISSSRSRIRSKR